jgi:3-dehydroquinate synthetase
LHGEAVAIGMAQAFRYSEQAGLCPPGTAATVAAHLAAAGLPTRISEIAGPDRPTADELLRLMSQDKKVKAGRMTFILVRGIGEAFITREVEMAQLRAFLEAEIGLR